MKLDEVLTFSEAAQKWKLADGKTIRKAVERGRFQPHEIKKSGNVWLTTYDAMQRVFGEPRGEKEVFYYRDIITSAHIAQTLEEYFQKAEQIVERGNMMMVVESEKHPDRILYIIKTKDDIKNERHRLQYFLQTNGWK